MFQRLTDRLQAIFKRLRGHGKLTEEEINTALRESRLALLEAGAPYGGATDLLYRGRGGGRSGSRSLPTLAPHPRTCVRKRSDTPEGGASTRFSWTPRGGCTSMMT